MTSSPQPDQQVTSDRKALEKLAYESAYSQDDYPVDQVLLTEFLNNSESFYQDLIKKYSPGRDVLEVGSGIGTHACLAALNSARSVLGIDVSESAVNIATERAQASKVDHIARFEVCDIETADLGQASFDLIIDHESLSSIDHRRMLPKLHAALRPGGIFLGMECLGHNVFFNLNRYIGLIRGTRTKWAVDNILRLEDLRAAQSIFKLEAAHYFHIFATSGALFKHLPSKTLRQRIATGLGKLDKQLLQVKFIQPWAFKVIFVLTKEY